MVGVRDMGRKGRGIYALTDIPPETMIEEAPLLLYSSDSAQDPFSHYCFEWDENVYGLALGKISLCNHSSDPNAEAVPNEDGPAMQLWSTRLIRAGEEITIDYGCELWFDPED